MASRRVHVERHGRREALDRGGHLLGPRERDGAHRRHHGRPRSRRGGSLRARRVDAGSRSGASSPAGGATAAPCPCPAGRGPRASSGRRARIASIALRTPALGGGRVGARGHLLASLGRLRRRRRGGRPLVAPPGRRGGRLFSPQHLQGLERVRGGGRHEPSGPVRLDLAYVLSRGPLELALGAGAEVAHISAVGECGPERARCRSPGGAARGLRPPRRAPRR